MHHRSLCVISYCHFLLSPLYKQGFLKKKNSYERRDFNFLLTVFIRSNLLGPVKDGPFYFWVGGGGGEGGWEVDGGQLPKKNSYTAKAEKAHSPKGEKILLARQNCPAPRTPQK